MGGSAPCHEPKGIFSPSVAVSKVQHNSGLMRNFMASCTAKAENCNKGEGKVGQKGNYEYQCDWAGNLTDTFIRSYQLI